MSDEMTHQEKAALAAPIITALGETLTTADLAWWHFLFVVGEVGGDKAAEFVKRALDVQSVGGLLTRDGSRPRTLGGVFFVLARAEMSQRRWIDLRAAAGMVHEVEGKKIVKRRPRPTIGVEDMAMGPPWPAPAPLWELALFARGVSTS